MTKRKTWRIWNILTSDEQDKFIRFLKAELKERQEFLQKLAYFLCTTSQNPSDTEAWNYLYPDKPYDDPRFRKICRDLTAWLEEFLAIEGFRKRKWKKELFLLSELADRHAREDFVKTYNRVEKSLQKSFKRESLVDQFLLKFELEVEKQNFTAINRLNPSILRGFAQNRQELTENQNLLGVSRAFVDFWAIQSFLMGMDNSIKNYQGDDPKLILFKQNLDLLYQAEFPASSPQLKIFQRLLAPAHASLQSYVELAAQIKAHATQFSKQDLQTAVVLLVNIFLKNLGKLEEMDAVDVMLDLFIWGILEGPLLNEGTLRAYIYNNLINTCIRTQKFGLAEKYLEELKELLSPQEREEAYAIGKARLLTAMNRPHELLRFMQNKQFKNPRYDIDARIRILQAGYEIDSQDEIWLVSQIATLQKLVRNKKGLPQNIQKQVLTFLKFMKLMVGASTDLKRQKAKIKIEEAPPFPNKYWLLNQLVTN